MYVRTNNLKLQSYSKNPFLFFLFSADLELNLAITTNYVSKTDTGDIYNFISKNA
jgi:hypothetical protein